MANGAFQINDIDLDIPPEQIIIKRRSVNNVWNTLRTRSSIKTKSGYSQLDVMCHIKFVEKPAPGVNGLAKLRDLVSQLRVTPFCWVENAFLRDSILGGIEGQSMVLALRHMEIRKATSVSPDVIEVDLYFAWFNYFPYLRDFTYREDIFLPKPVRNPKDSKAWQLLYKAEQTRGQYSDPAPSRLGTQNTVLKTWQHLLVPKKKYFKLKKELKTLRELQDRLVEGDIQRLGTSEQAGYVSSIIDRTKDRLSKEEYQEFAQSVFGRTTSMGGLSVHDTLALVKGGIETRQEIFEEYRNAFEVGSEWEEVKLYDSENGFSSQEYEAELGNKLDEAVKPDNRRKDGSVLMRREQVIDMRQMELIPTGISISFENVLATMPLIGQPYPTYQHIGSIDAAVTITMLATNETGVRAVTNFYTIVEDQAMKYRAIPAGQRNVRITNDLVNLCGLNEFIVESFDATTIPGQPGTTQMVLTLMDNPISANTREQLIPAQSFFSSQEMRLMVLEVLNNATRFEKSAVPGAADSLIGAAFTKFLYSYSGEQKGERQALFKNFVEEYAQNLSKAYANILQLLGDGLKETSYKFFPGLWISTDEDLPGIGRLQKDLHQPLAESERFDLLKSNEAIERLQKEEATRLATVQGFAGVGGGSRSSFRKMSTTTEVNPNQINSAFAKQARDALEIWQLIQENGGEDTDLELRREAMAKSQTVTYRSGFSHLKPIVEAFIVKALKDYQEFIIPFLDKILRSSVIRLPQFKKVQEALKKLHLQNSGTAYPDFPIAQVVARLNKNKTLYAKVLNRLDDAAFLTDMGLRGLSVAALINPDFYLYRGAVEAAEEIIGQDTINVVRQSIKEGQFGGSDTGRLKVEENWITGAYKKVVIGEQRYDRIQEASKTAPSKAMSDKIEKRREKLEEELNKESEDDSAEDQDQKEVRQQERRKAQQALKDLERAKDRLGYFQPNDLNGILRPSIYEVVNDTEGANSIQVSTLDSSNEQFDPLLVTVNRRVGDEANLKPTKHHGSVIHNLREDGSQLDFLSESDYRGTPFDPKKTPQWSWPVYPEAGTRIGPGWGWRKVAGHRNYHEGIDISSVTGGTRNVRRANTEALEVRAAADGRIVAVNEHQVFKKHGQTWGERKPKRNLQGPFADKEAEVTTSIRVRHASGFETVYKHMDWDDHLKSLYAAVYDLIPLSSSDKDALLNVKGGITSLGSVGNVGYSTGPHLHFEIRFNGKKIDPEPLLKGNLYRSQGPLSWVNPDSESLLTKSVEQFEKDITGSQGHSLMRAYPTFRLYFIESDLKERKRFAFDDFFSFSSVQEIQVIRSRKIAADLCVIRLTNVSGVLSNRKFRGDANEGKARGPDGQIVKEDPNKPNRANTLKENPIASLMLQPGIQIQLRLGYDNNPDELESLFNGVITDVQFSGTDDIVEITCQSFGLEMVQNIYGEAKTYGGIISDAGKTSTLLEQLMAAPELAHFGRWEHGDEKTNTAYSLLTARWKAQPQPQDDNIFAPTGTGTFGIFDDAPEYTMYRTTIWDVFQEMTLRHPGYVASPVPYDDFWGPRMTMFFGVPDQLYFARDPSDKENENMENLKRFLRQAADGFKNIKPELERLTNPHIASKNVDKGARESLNVGANVDTNTDIQDLMVQRQLIRFAKDRGFVKPFRSYHLLTSTNHILHNNITSSSWRAFNVVTLQYEDDTPDINEETGVLTFDDAETFTMACEAGIPDEEKREMYAQYHNCIGFEMAKRYCLSLLSNSLKEGYRGSIVTIGNEKIKPHDVCYLVDEYTDMYGPVEVEQVVHRFSQQSGFVTEITPDMCVHVNQMSTLTTGDAMGLMAEHGLRKIGFQSLASVVGGFVDKGPGQDIANRFKSQGLSASFLSNGVALGARAIALGGIAASLFFPVATLGLAVGTAASFVGAFILRKYVTRTQMEHPFRYSPLTLHGKPMIGGLPTRYVNGTFVQKVDKWFKDTGEAMPLYIDHLADKLAPNNWISPVGDGILD